MIEAADVRLLGEGLAPGANHRTACPECRQSHFVITRTADGLAFNCHRASCGVRGFVPDFGGLAGGYGYHEPRRPEQPLRPYEGHTSRLTVEDLEYFRCRFGLNVDHIDYFIRGASWDDAYALVVRDPAGRERGLVIRQPTWKGIPAPREGKGGPRANLFQAVAGPALAWYPPQDDGGYRAAYAKTVVVEDQLSAMRAAQCGYKAVALLGTNVTMSNNQVQEIAQESEHGVILALDADATSRAFSLGRRWGLAFKSFRVAILTEDIKDIEGDDNVCRTIGD